MITFTENPMATPTLHRDGLYMASNQAIADVGSLAALLKLLDDLVCELNVVPRHHHKIDMISAAAKAGGEMGARVQADLEAMHTQIVDLIKASTYDGKEPGNVDQ